MINIEFIFVRDSTVQVRMGISLYLKIPLSSYDLKPF